MIKYANLVFQEETFDISGNSLVSKVVFIQYGEIGVKFEGIFLNQDKIPFNCGNDINLYFLFMN